MLETLDLTHQLERPEYIRQLARRQIQLRELGFQVYQQKRPVVIVFEGWDAAGKGGVDQTHHREARSPRLRRLSYQRAARRRQNQTLSLSLLAQAAASVGLSRFSIDPGMAGF